MKKKIDLSTVSEEDLRDELNKRHVKATTSALRGCIAKCWHCEKSSNLKKWFHIESYSFEDNVYTSNYNLEDDVKVVCPNCNTANKTCKKWRYEMLKPNERDLHQLTLYELIRKFERNGGIFTKYYKYYGPSHYGEKGQYYEVPDRHTFSFSMDSEKYKKVEVSFR